MTSAPVTHKIPPAVKFGDRARIARRELGLSQAEFVALMQQHLPTAHEKAYSTWETGTTPENVVEVSEALEKVTGYPWTWFLRGMYVEPATPPDGGGVTAAYQFHQFPQRGRQTHLSRLTLSNTGQELLVA